MVFNINHMFYTFNWYIVSYQTILYQSKYHMKNEGKERYQFVYGVVFVKMPDNFYEA